MRISDWSSDVCSSDLLFSLRFRLRCRFGAASLLLLDAADGLDGQAQAALVVGLDDLDADLLADLEHIVDVGDAIVGDFGDVQQRSEEHTSELQSLMRSSYAVFCLKKKKINKYSH